MHLVIAVPQLLALPPEAHAPYPAFSRLARYAGAPERFPGGLDAALLAASGLPGDAPVAPLAALGAGFDPGEALIMRADPVTFVAGRDDVRLGGRVDDLSRADADALVAALNAHFAADGLVFHAPRPDAWFVVASSGDAPQTSALPEVTGAIHAHLPRGAQGSTWRRWLSEMQMLLHADAVNVARESAGRAPANGIWISGAGRRRDVEPVRARLFAVPRRDGDLARGLASIGGEAAATPPAGFAALPETEHAVIALSAVGEPDALRALAAAWLAPAVAALENGRLRSLALVTDADGGAAHLWRARPPSWPARLAGRLSSPPFAPPAGGVAP